MESQKHVLTGETLQRALNSTRSAIKLNTTERFVRNLSPAELVLYIGNPGYRFEGTATRVRCVRQLDPNATIQIPWTAHFEKSWLNQDAAVAWPWVESRDIPLGLDGRPA